MLVAAVVSALVDRAARLRAEAQRGRAEAEALARLAGWLLSEDDPLPDLVEHLRTTFGLSAVVGGAPRGRRAGSWRRRAGPAPPTIPRRATRRVELGPDTMLVLSGPRLPAEARRVLAAFAAQLTVAVREREFAREAEEAAEQQAVNDLRAAILAAVSHDLRTPLSSIKAAVSSLRQDDVAWTDRETAEFVATIEEETDRLNNLVGNLLDMSRIQTGRPPAGAVEGRAGRGRAEGAREPRRPRPVGRGRRARVAAARSTWTPPCWSAPWRTSWRTRARGARTDRR